MKRRLLLLALFVASHTAGAFEISELQLNEYVEQGLARRTSREIQLVDPKVSLLNGYATVCAKLSSVFLPKGADFCADVTPKWRQESGSLLATRMALVSLNAPGVGEKEIALLKTLINQLILPGLEGVELYRTDNFIGKQVSWIKVLPGKLELGF